MRDRRRNRRALGAEYSRILAEAPRAARLVALRRPTVAVVIGYQAAFGGPPPGVARAGLTATVAAVLSTYRSDAVDSVRDHRLWAACMEAVGDVVAADSDEVFAEATGALDRWRGRSGGTSLGTLRAYAERLFADAATPDWRLICWRRERRLVAAAVCEPWDRVGGPAPYHDSYTTCVFVSPSRETDVVERMRSAAQEAGGAVVAAGSMEIERVAHGPVLEEVRSLFREYARSLPVDLAYQDFARELAELPGDYTGPRGALFLGRIDGMAAGCVAVRRWDETACEMKRLYVRDTFKGRGCGRALAEHAIGWAREAGYTRVLLDTLPTMGAAQRLYDELGFRDIAAYRFSPVAGTRYMELRLG